MILPWFKWSQFFDGQSSHSRQKLAWGGSSFLGTGLTAAAAATALGRAGSLGLLKGVFDLDFGDGLHLGSLRNLEKGKIDKYSCNSNTWQVWYSGHEQDKIAPRYVRYSGGLNTKHWNTKHFEFRISNGLVLEWSVMAIAKAMVPTILKPNQWKSEQKWSRICADFQWF